MFTLRNQQINVSRHEMITKIKEGMAKHQAAYAEAHEDSVKALIILLDRIRAQVAAGNLKETTVNLPAPQSHLKEYQEAIEMLEMSVDETITLDRDAFKAYFNNEWAWSTHFESTSAMYKGVLASV